MKFKKELFRNYINSSGLKTKQRIVVIESDDWGSLRIPNKSVYNTLRDSSLNLASCPYSKFDCLENNHDFDSLFDLLTTFQKEHSKSPILTTNFLSANPDFEKIRQSDFSEYHYENIQETYNKNTNSENIKQKIQSGIKERFIKPQFHGREHLNVKMWMYLLNNNNDVRKAFDYNFFALSFSNSKSINLPYLASFMRYDENDDFSFILEEGLEDFNSFFDKYPSSFIAPVYVWDESIEKFLSAKNIESIQGLYNKKEFYKYNQNPVRKKRFNRRENSSGQLQLVRNCFFEPSTKEDFDWVNECLRDVEVAFRWSRPAIICSHRINFVGGLSESNRTKNLIKFNQLLTTIVKKWPDVTFVSSDEVVNYI